MRPKRPLRSEFEEHVEERWVFNLIGPKQDAWVWHRVGPNGKVVARSEGHFAYYLDVLADAKSHGFRGIPQFSKVPPAKRVR